MGIFSITSLISQCPSTFYVFLHFFRSPLAAYTITGSDRFGVYATFVMKSEPTSPTSRFTGHSGTSSAIWSTHISQLHTSVWSMIPRCTCSSQVIATCVGTPEHLNMYFARYSHLFMWQYGPSGRSLTRKRRTESISQTNPPHTPDILATFSLGTPQPNLGHTVHPRCRESNSAD